jgi:hypothetical protein
MSLSYKDFFPIVIKKGLLSNDYEDLSVTVKRASEWVEESGVRILNVETIVLPNIEGVEDASKASITEWTSQWYQVIRIWYEHPNQLVNPFA